MGGRRESWIEVPTGLTFSICVVRKAAEWLDYCLEAKGNAEWAKDFRA